MTTQEFALTLCFSFVIPSAARNLDLGSFG
jgi:hypothetical protein